MTDDEFDPVELRALLAKAKALRGDMPPRPEAWENIRGRIEALRVRELPFMHSDGIAPHKAESDASSGGHAIPDRTLPLPARHAWLRGPRTAMLAAAALFVAVTTTVVMSDPDRGRPQGTGTTGTVAEAPMSADTSMTPVYARYDNAADDLARDLNQRRTGLNPETMAVLDSCLTTLDNAIRESRSALATTPGNATIAELLQVTYEQKLDLLRRAADLPLGSL